MAKIKVPQLDKEFEAQAELSLMANLLAQDIPVASSCGGDGICGKCLMEVQGENLPDMSELEMKTLQKVEDSKGCRLSCQIKILDNIQVKTTYW